MKKFLLAVAAVLCVGSVAMAGVNNPGTILLHYNASAIGSDGIYAGYGGLTACDAAVTTAPAGGTTLQGAWFAYAAFASPATPRVVVITFGLVYDENNIAIQSWGKTATTELTTTTPAWPGNGSGDAVEWDTPQTAMLFEFYWFTGYGLSGELCLGPHPTQGGFFTDDSSPGVSDPIQAYGCLGFGTAGVPACPHPTPLQGACCFIDGTCQFILQTDCSALGGIFQGETTVCDPNPCPQPPLGACCALNGTCTAVSEAACRTSGGLWQGPGTVCDPNPCVTPVIQKTWGEIKHSYH